MRASHLLTTMFISFLVAYRGSIQSVVRDVPLDPECGICELSGNIRGFVRTSNGGPAKDVRVRFVMSDDASVVTSSDDAGHFEIRCVYPATGYQICLGPEGDEQCQIVKGPNASATHHVLVATDGKQRSSVVLPARRYCPGESVQMQPIQGSSRGLKRL